MIFTCINKLNNNGVDVGNFDSGYDTVSFEQQVAPILRANCALAGCHDANGKKNLRFPFAQEVSDDQIYAVLLENASTGIPLIDPGRPSNSEIIIRLEAEAGQMPPLERLPAAQRNDFRFWVVQGAKR